MKRRTLSIDYYFKKRSRNDGNKDQSDEGKASVINVGSREDGNVVVSSVDNDQGITCGNGGDFDARSDSMASADHPSDHKGTENCGEGNGYGVPTCDSADDKNTDDDVPSSDVRAHDDDIITSDSGDVREVVGGDCVPISDKADGKITGDGVPKRNNGDGRENDNGKETGGGVPFNGSGDGRENYDGDSDSVIETVTTNDSGSSRKTGGNVKCDSGNNTIGGSFSEISCRKYDIGLIIDKNIPGLSSVEIIHYLKHHIVPESGDKLFERKVTKGKDRKVKTLTFQISWLKEHPWLVYSPCKEGGFCKWCVLFLTESKKQNLGAFVKQPFQKLEKATGTDGELQYHANRDYHKFAQSRAHAFLATTLAPQTAVNIQVNKNKEEQLKYNYHILECIVDSIILCGMQNIPLRGHRDDWTADPTSNKGNQAKSDSRLREHIETGKRNAKYTSKTIQNQVIGIIREYIQENLTTEIRKNKQVFSVIADEVTDQYANKEILSVCLRYVGWDNDQPFINEVFYDFVAVERATGKEIANAIVKVLDNLDLKLLRGQAYDGAAVMSGGTNGVQALVKDMAPMALYTHCSSHLLNLSVAASCKTQEVRNVIDVINDIYCFLDNSPKRQRFLERVLKVHSPKQKSKHLVGMCKTRWIQRHTCLQSYMEFHEYLAILMDAITNPASHEDVYTKVNQEDQSEVEDWKWDRETKTKAQGFYAIMTSFGHICSFVIAKSCLEPIKPLAAKLQKRDQDVLTAYRYIDGVHDEIKQLRQNIDSEFQAWYDTALKMAETVETSESIPRRVSRQCHRSNTPAETPSQYYKRVVAIPMLDNLQVQMKDRFDKENRHAMKIFSLVPSAVVKNSIDDTAKSVMNGATFWLNDLPSPDSLKAEVKRWHNFWKTQEGSKQEIPDTFLKALSYADVDFYPNIHVLLNLAATLPISSCEAERSFSAFRRTKSYLRSRMGEERLTGLVLMNVHYALAQKMDRREIMERFRQIHNRRMFDSNMFFDSD